MSALSLCGWIGTFLCLAGSVVVGRKVKYGFLCQMTGNLLWLVVGVGTNMPSLIVCSAAFASIYVYNFLLWSRQERGPGRPRQAETRSEGLKVFPPAPSSNGPLRRP